MLTTSDDLKIQVEFGVIIQPGGYPNRIPYVYNRCGTDRNIELAEITRAHFYQLQRVTMSEKRW